VREAYVHSHNALDIFGLEGQVPDSRVKGEPTDISTTAEYEWYEWVKFCDTSARFPVSKVQLGRHLGLAIDIGCAMACKITKANGQVMYRTYVRSLTPEEIVSPVEKQARFDFDIQIEETFRPPIAEADFIADPNFTDFAPPNLSHVKMTRSLLPICLTLMTFMMLILMTNMLELKLEFQLAMVSGLGRSCDASVHLTGL
jgi:hypothetical protein